MKNHFQSALQTTNRKAECASLAATSARVEGQFKPAEETHKKPYCRGESRRRVKRGVYSNLGRLFNHPTERNQHMKNKKKKPQWRIVWELPNGSKMPGAGRFGSQKKAELAAAQHTYNYYFNVEEVPE